MSTQHPAPSPTYLGPPSKHSGTGNKPIDRIVLHGTTGAGAASKGYARRIAAYFRSEAARGSAHYIIDPGEVVQSAYDDVIAWHAPPNPRSLGLEFCDPVSMSIGRWSTAPFEAMLKRGSRLTAELCLAYDVPARFRSPKHLRGGGADARGICEHSDVSEAFKQSSHWDLGAFPRQRFIRMVRADIAEIRGDRVEAGKQRKKARSRVTRARDLVGSALRATKNRKRRTQLQAGLDALPKR